MKILERAVYIFLIISLIMVSINNCTKPSKIITIPGDSIFTETIIEKPIYKTITVYDTDTLWLAGDTIKITDTILIYNDYFKMYTYNDTVKNDSSMTIIRDIQITQNKLYREKYYTKNNREQQIIEDYNNGISVGGIVGVNILAPMISYQFNKHNFGLGYNFSDNNGVILKYEYKFKK